nr:GPI-anchored protein like [Ipomoea batatas]
MIGQPNTTVFLGLNSLLLLLFVVGAFAGMQNSKDSEMRYAFYRSLPTYAYWEFAERRTAELAKYPCLIRRCLLLSLLLPHSISTSSPSSSGKGRDPKEAYSKKPRSGFYIAIVIDGEMVLFVGDSQKEGYSKTRSKFPATGSQNMVLRREHIYGGKLYITRAIVGDRDRNISINCRLARDDLMLYFYVDNKRVLQVKHLKWEET